MGIPKFYRWISERYSCISELVRESQIPEIDNLYVDMNDIFHACSHPEDDNPHFRITEEEIFAEIVQYIEVLFCKIKPRKVFFMAVDGVAPRAKNNSQRGGKFRTAREKEEQERLAIQNRRTLPTEKRFDPNCITPGTLFMVRLQKRLGYFVVEKISTDPLWQGVKVYLSGHETPGEGEHKVMDFIRAERSDQNYDANTRHCWYGNDADLIILGLTLHETHFCLLREEKGFGGITDGRNNRAQMTSFRLLHLSILREYLDFEFSVLKRALPTFRYNLANVIDDWVLMGFLVGNDFIPHLPNLHINRDAFPLLYQTYKEVLPTLGGYINEGGHLNLERFEKYLTALSKEISGDSKKAEVSAGQREALSGARERVKCQEISGDSKKAEVSAGQREALSEARERVKCQDLKESSGVWYDWFDLQEVDHGAMTSEEPGTELVDSSVDETSEEILDTVMEESDDVIHADDEIWHHKCKYYMTKMDYENVPPEVVQDQVEGYVRGIQWILLYYYEGVPSWNWYYQHHYAPNVSHLKNIKDVSLSKFDLGTPFKPFEQMMAILPLSSKDLLPLQYQSLMTDDTSPLKDFYPLEFEIDRNGKQNDWEAVVLIPIIDTNRLFTAIRSLEHSLTAEEKARNGLGPHLYYEYTPDAGELYHSPSPALSDITVSRCIIREFRMDGFRIPREKLRKGMLSGAKLNDFLNGFASIQHAYLKEFLTQTNADRERILDKTEELMKTNEMVKSLFKIENNNEQYSRRNNLKIKDISEEINENIEQLTKKVLSLLQRNDVDFKKEEIAVIQRIPKDKNQTRPVLIKTINNEAKVRIMKNRTLIKEAGHKLVDDVTKLNSDLINRLWKHRSIKSAWFKNGCVHGLTLNDEQIKFDLFDNIEEVIKGFIEKNTRA